MDTGILIKLCDTLSILKPASGINESGIKTTIKNMMSKIPNNGKDSKALNFQLSYFLFNAGEGVTIAFVAKKEVSEDKLQDLFEDLKRDLL